MIKTPKPSFAERLRKTILYLHDTLNQNVYESRFSQNLYYELGFHRHFYQGREYKSVNLVKYLKRPYKRWNPSKLLNGTH